MLRCVAVEGDKYVPLSAVAARLGVSVKTVRRWRATGEMRMCKFGGRWKVADSEVEAYIARATHQSPPDPPPLVNAGAAAAD